MKKLISVTIILTILAMPFVTIHQAAASGPPTVYTEPFGVAVTPPLWLENFLILYFSNPDVAANMPAYRAAIPLEVYNCLVENPKGCPYDGENGMAQYFEKQALEIGGSRNKSTLWPISCQSNPRWEALAPPEYRQPEHINEPLGRKEADRLAVLMGISEDMILTEEEYKCMTGLDQNPPSDEYHRRIIRICMQDLTNSKDNAKTPLSSYGLSLNAEGYVRSNCAPDAPCLLFNQLAKSGDLVRIARECGFPDKLKLLIDPLVTNTPIPEFSSESVDCQEYAGDPCIAVATSPSRGGKSHTK